MRWNVCASVVRSCSCGAFGTTNTTHIKIFHFVVPWAAEKSPIPNNPPRLHKTMKIERLRFKSNNRATKYSPWHANNQLVVRFGTHTPTPTHTTLLVVASKHRSAALPTQRRWCMRWNVCAFCCSILLVRDIWDNEHNTHQKHFTSLCPGLRKTIPSQKTLLVYTKP